MLSICESLNTSGFVFGMKLNRREVTPSPFTYSAVFRSVGRVSLVM